MICSKAMVLPLLASVAVFLVLSPCPVHPQSIDPSGETPSTTTTSATLEETTVTPETTIPSVTTPSSPSSLPEGGFNSPCNATHDCQPHKSLECLEGVCHCPVPQVFDIRVERCVIPLGKQCDSSDILGENMCPEFAECFMDRCVCKTGYSMHTLTRCKSDLIEASGERKPIVLWPPPSAAKGKEESDERGSCTSETCDLSKGLVCQEGKCKCKDSQEIFVEEFGRCLNTTMQKTLKDALSLVTTSEDEIKSFVKLLEKIDGADQEIGGSDHYNSPVHQLLGLLGGNEYRGDATHQPSTSQLAPPHSYRGDLHSAAQETVTETAVPSGGVTQESGGSSGVMDNGEVGKEPGAATPSNEAPGVGPSDNVRSPESHISPVSAANAETSSESGEALTYNSESQESVKRPSPSYPSLPLDNLQYSPQSQEPAIVQRQAPPYLQGDGIPLQGIGNIPGGNHFRLPIQEGYGGLGPYGGQINLGHGGLGGFGGFGQGLGGFGQGGGGFGQGGGQFGQGGGGHGLSGFGGQLGGGGFGGPQGGFGGGPGHQGGGGGHGEPPKPKGEGLLIDVAEFVGRSLKLVDRFLPLVHAINDVLKKEGLFEKKEGGLFGLGGLGGGGPGGPRGRRFGENSKEVEELSKDGGDDTLKKLLA